MAKTNHVIISYYANKDQAATAGDELREWDKANDAIKLGGLAVLTSKNGKIKTHKISSPSTRRGAKWGLALGAAAGILSGGVTLVGGAVVGTAAGAVGAKLFHRSLGLSDADKARLEKNLAGGQAALVVMAVEDEVNATKAELAALGGKVEDYEVPAATMAQVEAATGVEEELPEVGEVPPAAEDDVTVEPAAAAAAAAAVAADEPRVVLMPGTLESVEGIGPAYVTALKANGVTTKRRLLLAGGTPEGRAKLAAETKIPVKNIEKWVSAVDLARISGVKAQYSELLVAGGVTTVGRMAEQEAAGLHDQLATLNAQKNLTRLVPGTAQLGNWIETAKGLPEMVTM